MSATSYNNGSNSSSAPTSDEVFSSYPYTGNSTARYIQNGVNLAANGGMVWIKGRNAALSSAMFDSARGVTKRLKSDSINAEQTYSAGISSFNSDGFSLGVDNVIGDVNTIATTYSAWTFRKAAKFFDVVTWTGNATNRIIPHSLGQEVGMIIVKRMEISSDWIVYHRSMANNNYLVLSSTTGKGTDASFWNATTATSTGFSIGTAPYVNALNNNFVAYVFAHDSSTNGIIQCGAYTGNGSTDGAEINLGWEPQFVMVKSTLAAGGNWLVLDSERNFIPGGGDGTLCPNSYETEAFFTSNYIDQKAYGFKVVGINADINTNSASNSYIYMAIRRPNKVPSAGTQVFSPVVRTANNTATSVAAGFSPDLVMIAERTTGFLWSSYDRLRGQFRRLNNAYPDPDIHAGGTLSLFQPNGVTLGADDAAYGVNRAGGGTMINYFFKRAPGVFDTIRYTGSGSNKTEGHNLGVAPELWIVKSISAATGWRVGCTAMTNTEYLTMETSAAKASDATSWNSTFPSNTVLSLGTQSIVNANAATYIAYFFASRAGVSKVFSYTGNGSSQTINCGFSTGARFVLIKRTDSTGAWIMWDTARGIASGNDPHLSFTASNVEVTTDDSIDPDTSGFIVNQVAATNINITSATYIGLSFA
jgi:hypothetical protein